MIPYIIVFVFFLLGLIFGLKKCFAFYVAYYFIDYGLYIYSPITVKNLLLLFFLFYGVAHYKKRLKNKYILKWATWLMVISALISNLLNGCNHPTAFIYTLFDYFALPYVVFLYVHDKEDLIYLCKCFLLSALFVCLYGLYEIGTETTPLVDYIKQINNQELIENDSRFGAHLTRSTFLFHTSLGYFAIMTIVFLMLYINQIKNMLHIKNLYFNIFVLMLASMVFLSGSRSSIAPLLIFVVLYPFRYIVDFSRFIKNGSVVVITYVFVMYFIGEYFEYVINSILYSDKYNVGSSQEMRTGQLMTVLYYFAQAPLWGHGFSFTGSLIGNVKSLMGAESIWFGLLLDQGLIGVICFIVFIMACFKTIKFQIVNAIFFVGVFVFVNTITSVPDLFYGFYMMFIVLIYKMKHFNLIV